jgi:hypothetical protein
MEHQVNSAASEILQTRACILARKLELREVSSDLAKEAKTHPANSPERNRLYGHIQSQQGEQLHLENMLGELFVPQHGPNQLLSPRAFFVSSLFRVCSKRLVRQREVSLEIRAQGGAKLTYTGPELRQPDGLVFMGLLNLVRDVRAGETVSFSAESLCRTIFGRYDGPTRVLLKDHIKRLQRGLIEAEGFSVQLALRFDYPKTGAWKIALDKEIVQLFKRSAEVWLDLPKRQALPEGLTTWLYAFIESQTRLIPTPIIQLRDLCGSDANAESFPRTLRLALKELTQHQIIDPGWSMKQGMVRWRKYTGSFDSPALVPAPSSLDQIPLDVD